MASGTRNSTEVTNGDHGQPRNTAQGFRGLGSTGLEKDTHNMVIWLKFLDSHPV